VIEGRSWSLQGKIRIASRMWPHINSILYGKTLELFKSGLMRLAMICREAIDSLELLLGEMALS
jgi:hypothetical protein